MPRPALPTPASSTDIQGEDGSKQLAALQMAFELPPPAMTTATGDVFAPSTDPTAIIANACAENNLITPPIAPKSSKSASQAYPVQAAETVKSRRRSSTHAATAAAAKDAFALPPPPTRSRKIIQMKPRTAAPADTAEELPAVGRPGKNAKATATAAVDTAKTMATTTTTTGKRKQPSSTSAAGRKIARKTAHSLIERRRRSKMNEEFAVLKNMIPACTGEMHKLAILQASIEYMRYLEDCVATLKAQSESEQGSRGQKSQQYNPERPFVPHAYTESPVSPDIEMTGVSRDDYEEEDEEADDADDVDEMNKELPSPALTAMHARSQQSSPSASSSHNRPSVSPALLAQDVRYRQDSQPSMVSMASAAEHHRHYSYSYSTSTQASPAFGPTLSYLYASASMAALPALPAAAVASAHSSVAGSTLTSPALLPQRDMDQEATAALLMLNSDRRGMSGSSSGANTSGRGMSVRDLLST